MTMSLMVDSWISLGIAIVFGVLGTLQMKLSRGLQKTKHIIYLAIFYSLSFIALTFAMQYIELSIIYAVWSGVGTILIAIMGIVLFNESLSVRKIAFLLLIIIGVIGIHLSDGLH